MENKALFNKYYSRLMWEGLIKSLICGFLIGFSLSFISAVIAVIADFSGILLSICVALGTAGVSTPIFYFKRFRPTTKKIAEKIDRLGLEERLITMMDLEKDESYMAMRQREDAKAKLSKVRREQLKFSIFKAPVIALAIVAVLSILMTTASVLYAMGENPFDKDPSDGDDPVDQYFSVEYLAAEGGRISGEADQYIFYEDSTSMVVAVADDGYVFSKWSDGLRDPERADILVRENLVFEAEFEKTEEGDGEGKTKDDDITDIEPSEGDGDDPSISPDPQGTTGHGGRYDEANQIINGEQFYRDHHEAYRAKAEQIITEKGEIPDSLRKIVEAYFETIK